MALVPDLLTGGPPIASTINNPEPTGKTDTHILPYIAEVVTAHAVQNSHDDEETIVGDNSLRKGWVGLHQDVIIRVFADDTSRTDPGTIFALHPGD